MTTPARGLPWGKSTAGQKTKKRKEKRGQPIRKMTSSSNPINLEAFYRAPYSERALLLKTLYFIHEKKTALEREKLAIIETRPPAPFVIPDTPVALPPPVPAMTTPPKSSNANPPFVPPKPLKKTARMTAPDKRKKEEKEEEESEYEVIIHKVSFDSDSEKEDGFIVHKQKKRASH
jgi:hypothetical protein